MMTLRYCSSRNAVCLERKRRLTVLGALKGIISLVGVFLSGVCFALVGFYAHAWFILPDKTVQTEQGYHLSTEYFIYKKRALPAVEESLTDEETVEETPSPSPVEERDDNSDLKARVKQAMAEIEP